MMKVVTGFALVLLLGASIGCGGGESDDRLTSGQPAGQAVDTPEAVGSLVSSLPAQSQITSAELRPEAVGLIDLSDPLDLLVAGLFSDEYLAESAVIDRQVTRAESLQTPLTACLVDRLGFGEAEATEAANGIINRRFAFKPVDGDLVEPAPSLPSPPSAPGVDQSECGNAVEEALAYVSGGIVGYRASHLKSDAQWVEPPNSESLLRESLNANCPGILDGTSQTCDRLNEYLLSAVEVHRSIVASNLDGLSR